MSDRAAYSRVYWSVMDDDKFDGIREDVRHFGSWCLMLLIADMAYPAPGYVPAVVPRSSVRALTECGLIDSLSGGRFRVHGLAAEREMRSHTGRIAAGVRWQSNGRADPMLDETRRELDKTSTRLAKGVDVGRGSSDDRPRLASVEEGR